MREKASRQCGECSACCTVLGIERDDTGQEYKQPGVRCEHQKVGGGCAVYGSHPVDCKSYRCGWLQGAGKKKDRPDRSGVVMNRSSLNESGNYELVTLVEGRKGALKGRAGKRLLRQGLSEGKIVRRVQHNDFRDIIVKNTVRLDPDFVASVNFVQMPIHIVPSRK